MQNGTTTVENSVEALPKIQVVNHHMTQQFYFRVYTKRTESRDANRCLYTNVYCRIIHHNQKVETTQILTHGWMGKQNVAHTYYSALERKEIMVHAATHSIEDISLSEINKPVTKKITTVWCHSNETPRIIKFIEISVVAMGQWEEGMRSCLMGAEF